MLVIRHLKKVPRTRYFVNSPPHFRGGLPLAELAVALRRAKERLRHKRAIIQACISQAGYYV
jgi:hypothetical protein